MLNINATIEMSKDFFMDCINGAALLSAQLSWERARKDLHPVTVDEKYFLRYAVHKLINELEEEQKSFNEN